MQATLTDFMQTQPEGTREERATRYQVSLLKVINTLPGRALKYLWVVTIIISCSRNSLRPFVS